MEITELLPDIDILVGSVYMEPCGTIFEII